MTVPAIVAFKNPAQAKQRLAQVLSVEERGSIACAMFSHVLSALNEATEIGCVTVVGEGDQTEALCASHKVTYLREPNNRGYNEAISFALRKCRDQIGGGVVILASDLPLLTAYEINRLARPCLPGTVRVAASLDGTGTNALYLNPANAIAPAFGEGSAERHCLLAREAGIDAEVIRLRGLGFDVDTPSDLRALNELQASKYSDDMSWVKQNSNLSR